MKTIEVAVASDHDLHETSVVRLDRSALGEARSILFQAYRNDPTFGYLLERERSGYEQRVRGTLRELTDLYWSMEQDVIGLLKGGVLVAVAFIGSPDIRLDLRDNWVWRMRMILTAGFASTNRYIDYHEQIKACLPKRQLHQLPLMGVHPRHQNRGLGRMLLETVERVCSENPRTCGIVLDTGNSAYLQFYESMGYRRLGEVKLGHLTEYVLFKDCSR